MSALAAPLISATGVQAGLAAFLWRGIAFFQVADVDMQFVALNTHSLERLEVWSRRGVVPWGTHTSRVWDLRG